MGHWFNAPVYHSHGRFCARGDCARHCALDRVPRAAHIRGSSDPFAALQSEDEQWLGPRPLSWLSACRCSSLA